MPKNTILLKFDHYQIKTVRVLVTFRTQMLPCPKDHEHHFIQDIIHPLQSRLTFCSAEFVSKC